MLETVLLKYVSSLTGRSTRAFPIARRSEGPAKLYQSTGEPGMATNATKYLDRPLPHTDPLTSYARAGQGAEETRF
jgi:hypothetical protein